MTDHPEAVKERERIVALLERRLDDLRDRQKYPSPNEDASDTDARINELNRAIAAIREDTDNG